MKKLLMTAVCLCFFLTGAAAAAQFPTEWAVVKKGAFVIPSKDLPWTDPEGRAAGKRIGYMRVGTVVRVGDCTHVNGPDIDSTGAYCNVQSEIGVEGKTLQNRLFPLESGKTFAVARNEIILYDRRNPSKRRDSFSRNAGVMVQVIGNWQAETQNGMVDVIATYNLSRAGALTELAINKEDLIKNTYVIEMSSHRENSPRKFQRERASTGEWILTGNEVAVWSIKPALKLTANRLSKQVLEDIGWDEGTAEEAEKLLSSAFDITTSILDRLRCVSEIDTAASAGFEFLGSGLKLSGKIPVYSKGKLFDFDVDIIERNGIAQYWILTAKTVNCSLGETLVDSEPHSVEKVMVLSIKNRPPDGAPARITVEFAKRYGLSIPDAVDSQNIPRLFIIGEFKDYIAARKLIATRIANSALLDQMTRQERILLQHAMITKLGQFERNALLEDIE